MGHRLVAISILFSLCIHAQSDSLVRENKMDSLIRRGDMFFQNCNEDSAKWNYNLAMILKHPGNAHKQDHIIRREAEMQIPEWCMESGRYKLTLQQGDRAMSEKNYADAKARYSEALLLKPADPYPLQKLAECDKLIFEEERAKELQAKYDREIFRGDSAFRIRDWATAKQSYLSASAYKPMEQYPKDQIRLCDLNFGCRGNLHYDQAIKKADSLFKAANYTEARLKYQEALGLKSAEQYPKDQIAKCDAHAPDENSDIRYNAAIADGDKFFAKKDWHKANIFYHQAADYKPAEKYPKDRIAECERNLHPANYRYERSIQSGDSLYKLGLYIEAKSEYTNAVLLKPAEMYPKDRIAACDENVRSIQQRKEYDANIKMADSLFNSGNYAEAKKWYQRAAYSPLADTYPEFQISKCDQFLKKD